MECSHKSENFERGKKQIGDFGSPKRVVQVNYGSSSAIKQHFSSIKSGASETYFAAF